MRTCSSALVLAVAVLLAPQPLRAQPPFPNTPPVIQTEGVEGFGPDAQLTGGLGFGFEGKLDNYFLARARIGGLYASAPWIFNLGATLELGALAGLGWGGELELSRSGALYGNLGLARVDESRWQLHAGIGFMIFGLEWQHRFGGPEPHNALLFEVRLPLGLWWLQQRQEKAATKAAARAHTPEVKPRMPAARVPLTAAGDARVPSTAANGGSTTPAGPGENAARSGAQAAAEPTPGGAGNHPEPATGVAASVAALELEYAARLAEASAAREKGDRLAEAFALSRAYSLRKDPSVALQLSAAELALHKPRAALADWQRIGNPEQLPAAERERAAQLKRELDAALGKLRIELSGATTASDQVWIDDVAEPTATQGYDVPLDPGAHTLQIRRGERVLQERQLEARPGELQRLDIELPANP
jgi:hypothetical protein